LPEPYFLRTFKPEFSRILFRTYAVEFLEMFSDLLSLGPFPFRRSVSVAGGYNLWVRQGAPAALVIALLGCQVSHPFLPVAIFFEIFPNCLL